ERSGRPGAQIEWPALRGAHSGEIEKLREQTRQPVGFAHDERGQELLVGVDELRAPQLLHRRANGRKRILDLVRQARRQLRDRLETFRAQVKLLEPLR